jgi:hypothetical protein
MSIITRFLETTRRMHFHYLLASLVLFLVAYPYLGAGPVGAALLKAFTSIILFTGIYAVSDRRRQIVIASILAVPAFAFGWLFLVTGTPFFDVAETITSILFYAYTALMVLSRVLGSQEITTDTVYGAVAVYLLLGLSWATVYSFIGGMHPESFAVGASHTGALGFPDFIYFSFVTLATLGYGDITPATAQTQSLAILEAVTGVIFIAVLVARLVGALGWSPRGDAGQR